MQISEIQNRFAFHSGARESKADELRIVRQHAYDYALLINDVAPDGREKSTALTYLETALMWATKAVALSDPETEPLSSLPK